MTSIVRYSGLGLLLGAMLLANSCAWRPYATELRPMPEGEQGESMTIADDGTVTYTYGRLEVRLQPLTDASLNRLYGGEGRALSENPYTYSDVTNFYTGDEMQRFTVFRLGVKNYEFPKVRLAGDVVLEADNGRTYYSLTMHQLDRYFRAYAIGYRGNEYNVYKERRARLQSQMFPNEDIFSGQDTEGRGEFVLFEPLADDVSKMTVTINDLVTRFDFRGEPVDAIDVSFRFERDIGKIWPDGTVALD